MRHTSTRNTEIQEKEKSNSAGGNYFTSDPKFRHAVRVSVHFRRGGFYVDALSVSYISVHGQIIVVFATKC